MDDDDAAAAASGGKEVIALWEYVSDMAQRSVFIKRVPVSLCVTSKFFMRIRLVKSRGLGLNSGSLKLRIQRARSNCTTAQLSGTLNRRMFSSVQVGDLSSERQEGYVCAMFFRLASRFCYQLR